MLVLLMRLLLSSELKCIEATSKTFRREERVRIPGSRRWTVSRPVAAVICSAALLGACGSGEADEQLARAQEQSEQALDRIGELEDRLDELQGDLDAARASNEDLTGRLDAVRGKLEKSIDGLRGSLEQLEDSVAGADADADEALGAAGEAARDISVLGNRLDYHLRNHGGG
jgi:septal ring factor EnvC (AmiA/AmiB activator)